MQKPDKTDKKQTKFRKGSSGNPLGRPKGVRNKATLIVEALFDSEVEIICRKAIEEAKKGNLHAIKIILDRILPAKKDSPIYIPLPSINTPSDILDATQRIIFSVGYGEITPSEGEAFFRLIDIHVKTIELYEFEQRLKVLEGKIQ